MGIEKELEIVAQELSLGSPLRSLERKCESQKTVSTSELGAYISTVKSHMKLDALIAERARVEITRLKSQLSKYEYEENSNG